MKKKRSVLALLLVAALTVVLGGCQDGKDGKADSSDTTSSQVSTESTPTGEPVMGGSITVGIPQDIEDSLDPHKSVAAGTKEILFNIYEGLVKPDEEGNLNDAVAESHSISEDGKVYTFKLRNGVKFHDGTTVTAEDVKDSIGIVCVVPTTLEANVKQLHAFLFDQEDYSPSETVLKRSDYIAAHTGFGNDYVSDELKQYISDRESALDDEENSDSEEEIDTQSDASSETSADDMSAYSQDSSSSDNYSNGNSNHNDYDDSDYDYEDNSDDYSGYGNNNGYYNSYNEDNSDGDESGSYNSEESDDSDNSYSDDNTYSEEEE